MGNTWWKNASGAIRFYPKHDGISLNDIRLRLDHIKEWGFDAIEVFAPIHGNGEYAGLDVIDFYQVDPDIGNMDDFKRLIHAAHQKGIHVIAFINLGYCALESPYFIKACDDVREGKDSDKAHWFIWSETGTETFDKSLAPHFLNDDHGYWHYSDRAQKYYWVKWSGINGDTHLPQLNFGDRIWQKECPKIVKFWMDTGIDGMIIDAVNWYINCNWQINNETMTDIIHQYPNSYIQPEGAGGFQDDPVPWIRVGRYNSVQDYGLNCWWNGHDVVGEALEKSNPKLIEESLQLYRDKVVEAGGITYIGPHWQRGSSLKERLLEVATIASVGQFFHAESNIFDLEWTEENKNKLKQILQALQTHSALKASGSRKKLPVLNDENVYAFVRTSNDAREKILVVLNYSDEEKEVIVDLSGESVNMLKSIFSDKEYKINNQYQVNLPAYGYNYYLMIKNNIQKQK